MIGIKPVTLKLEGWNETKHDAQTIILSFDFKGIGLQACLWGNQLCTFELLLLAACVCVYECAYCATY